MKPGERDFPKRGYDHGVDGREEDRLGERMSEEEWEQSDDESGEAEWDEVDKGNGEEQGGDGGGEKEGCVRRLVGQMREEREDGVVYVGTANAFTFRVILKRQQRRTQSP